MPKRRRGDEGEPPLSALAQRRSQKAVVSEEPKPSPPAPPQPPAISPEKQSSASIRIPATESPSKQLTEEMIQHKRQEIEEKIAAKRAESHYTYFRRNQFKVLDGRSGGGSTEESAVARLRKRADEAAAAAAADRDDGGTMSLDESSSGEEVGGEDVIFGDGGSSTPEVIQVSSFIPTSTNYFQEKGYSTFRLLAGETLVLIGEYRLEVVSGSINISGASLTRHSGLQVVYAPLTHALPVIVCLDRVEGGKSRTEDIHDAELIVRNHNSGVRGVAKVVPMFKNIWKIAPSQSADCEQNNTASFHPIFSSSNPPTILSIPQPWEATLCTLSQKLTAWYDRPCTPPYASTPSGASPPIILVSGGKSTGKSTFARILTNKLHTAFPEHMVSYLDIDPGQPEFSAPGIISLYMLSSPVLGPPFTHPNPSDPLLKAHYIGYTTPKEDPSHYISAVAGLLQAYRRSACATPLVINTCGWTKGIGLELLSEIIQLSAPSDVVLLSHTKDTTTSTSSITDLITESATLHNLPSSSSSSSSPGIPSKYTPSDLRALQTSSYLHFTPLPRDTKGGGEREHWDFETRLVSRRPLVVSYSGPKTGISGVSILGEQLSPVEVETAINGLLVGIVLVQNPQDFATQPPPPPPSTEIPLFPHPTPPPTETSFCGGTILIRAIDTKKHELHIISSLAQGLFRLWEEQRYKVVLVRGRMELPVWEYLGVEGEGEQEMLWVGSESGSGSGGQGRKGAAVWKVRRNVMRRGQMKSL